MNCCVRVTGVRIVILKIGLKVRPKCNRHASQLAFHLKVDSAYGVSTIAVPVAEIGGFTIAKAPVNNHPTRILLNIDVSVTDYLPSTALPYAGNRSGKIFTAPATVWG